MRNLRILGLAFVAMLAFGAVAASAASADDFTAESYPATLTGTNEAGFQDQFVTTAGTFVCLRATSTATISGPTTSVTVTPNFSDPHPTEPATNHNCTANGIRAIIDMNGCDFVFNVGVATTGDVDISCPAGQEITGTVIPTATGTSPCTLHIAGQNDIGGTATYVNLVGPPKEITVNANLSGIDYKHTAGTGLAKCTGGSAFNGTLVAKTTITGENDGPTFTKHVGLFMS